MILEPTCLSASSQWNTSLRMSEHRNTVARLALCPKVTTLKVKSFPRDLLHCNAWQSHLWCPLLGRVRFRCGIRKLKRRRWTHSKIEWWWVQSTAREEKVMKVLINPADLMTHNYQATSRLEERSATAEKCDNNAHAAYKNEVIFCWKAEVIGVKCSVALIGEMQPKPHG